MRMKKERANIVDIQNKRVFSGEITFDENGIKSIVEHIGAEYSNFIMPGFVDSHIHIESTMMSPNEFARNVVKNGTVSVVADPHEIANVCGVDGVEYMLENSKDVPFKFYYGVPSCVPATPFEICGGEINASDVDKLFSTGKYKFLGEFMNMPGLISGDEECVLKAEISKKYNLPIDGHAPGLSGNDLKKYVSAGISTDHEFFSFENSIEKIEAGMKIQIREGSASRDFEDLYKLIDMYPESIMMCTDDSHPKDIIELGHIDKIVRRAIEKGLDVFNVLQAACVNPVNHYNLEVGLLREGDKADFIIVEDLVDFKTIKTVIDSHTVFEGGKSNIEYKCIEPINNFNTKYISTDDIQQVNVEGKKLKVINVVDGSLVSDKILVKALVEEGLVVSDTSEDILKIVLHNRYTSMPVQLGFIKGFGLKRGAFASSVSHDSHNILAIGTNDDDLVKVVNTIVEAKGGLAVCDNEEIDILALPIAGLMSNKDINTIADTYSRLKVKLKAYGCILDSPFMTMAFMSLIVIPELKLGSRGLFEFSSFEFVDLFE
jgi:adenine deaminase